MTSINRSIWTLKIIIYVTIAILILGQLLFWLAPVSFDYISASHPIIDHFGSIDDLNITQKTLGFLITLAPKLVLIWSFILLLKLCNSLIAEDWFNRENEARCAKIGKWLMIYVAISIIHRTLLVLVVTMNKPEGERAFTISISSDDAMILVPALLALIIGHMLNLARRQRDELNEIV